MSKMLEIRWHGRAGQGVVTAGESLGEAALHADMFFQAFPEYGAERMGAPIKAYTRLSDQQIEIHSPILEPDMVIVVNPNLIGIVDMTEGLKPDGMLLVNTPQTPAEIRERLNFHTGTVWCVDATGIAMSELKRDIPSTVMLGVVAQASDVIALETIVAATRESLGSRLRPEVVDANVRALERANKECVRG
ncbi:MAG: 2-oxoacid:acceptor oxidoreductase family protein [Anaerolineae bacterium]|jgi:pyruvate ferredoxin oxidoreductase gamma subunit|nr:pyruvate synthase [Chloroflexota bacterium]